MKRYLTVTMLVAMAVLLGFGALSSHTAWALNITPDTETKFEISEGPGNTAIIEWIDQELGCTTTSLYKQDVGKPEEGSYAPYYTTTFNPASDPSGATITWDGPISFDVSSFDEFWMIVKDGNETPKAYMFDMQELFVGSPSDPVSWDGMETLYLSGFWDPGSGAISHVEFRTCGGTPIPEPATMLLLGTGLIGLAGIGRKKFIK